MRQFEKPDEAKVKELLSDAGLPTADLTARHMEHFFVWNSDEKLDGVVGLEIYGDVALLRSLAVRADKRGEGFQKPWICPSFKGTGAGGYKSNLRIRRRLPRELNLYGQASEDFVAATLMLTIEGLISATCSGVSLASSMIAFTIGSAFRSPR